MWYGALVFLLITAITDIRRMFKAAAVFLFKPGTDLVAFGTGSADTLADDDLVTDVGLFAAIAMDAEVVFVDK